MALRLIVVLAIMACGLHAQQKTVSSSTRPGVNDNADGALEGTRPEKVLQIVKSRGAVTSVDLAKRTVVLALAKGGPIELGFSQPTGREQIKYGRKSSKRLGVTRLRLEELREGAKVRVQYYPLLSQLMEIVVD